MVIQRRTSTGNEVHPPVLKSSISTGLDFASSLAFLQHQKQRKSFRTGYHSFAKRSVGDPLRN